MTDHDFQPSFLLSMPQMQDPNFARTVVLLCDFNPDGAFGLVLNRPTEMAARDMVRPLTADEFFRRLPVSHRICRVYSHSNEYATVITAAGMDAETVRPTLSPR